ncbi:MAG: hypothetical protein IJ134_05765 [Bacilli bacterium]|nr:hypothetical protein [Bacilli bacterium]
MKFNNINKSMNYLTKRFGAKEKNLGPNLASLISWARTANITEEEKQQILIYIEDEIKYGINLSDEQKEILLAQINTEPVKEQINSFRI